MGDEAKCRICGRKLNRDYTELNDEGNRMYCLVDTADRVFLLRAGDKLCPNCNKYSTWYKRMEG